MALEREVELVREAPATALLVVLAIGLALAFAWQFVEIDAITLEATQRQRKPIPDGPAVWRTSAKAGDILQVEGLRIAYWGNPEIKYSSSEQRSIEGIVVHCNLSCGEKQVADDPAGCPDNRTRQIRLVEYLHNGDKRRGGRYGYHFYVGRDGAVMQGAPLSEATNHIMPPLSRVRKPGSPSAWSNSTTIGLSLVGACDHKYPPHLELITEPQRDAALRLTKAIQRRYSLPCGAIFGHGEMQTNRRAVEGRTIAAAVRDGCP